MLERRHAEHGVEGPSLDQPAQLVRVAHDVDVLVEGSLDASSFIAYMGLAYNILTPAKAISKPAISHNLLVLEAC